MYGLIYPVARLQSGDDILASIQTRFLQLQMNCVYSYV